MDSRRRSAWSRLFFLVLATLAWIWNPSTTTGSAATFAYDAPAVALVDVHQLHVANVGSVLLGDEGKESASQSIDGQRTSTTPVATVVATEALPSAPASAFTRSEALSGRASTRTVSELAESMRTGGWQGEPIKVVEHNGQMLIVDGHHRVAAARIAGIEVPSEVVGPSTVIGPGQWSSLDDILRDSYTVGPDRVRPR